MANKKELLKIKDELKDASWLEITIVVIGALATIFCIYSLLGWIFMLLWNWIAPIFWKTCPILNFWQSVGAVLLLSFISVFFKSSKS